MSVVSMTGTPIPELEPNEDAIQELEALLERARSGEIVGIAWAAFYRDKNNGQNHAGLFSRGTVGSLFAIAARMSRQLDEDNAE